MSACTHKSFLSASYLVFVSGDSYALCSLIPFLPLFSLVTDVYICVMIFLKRKAVEGASIEADPTDPKKESGTTPDGFMQVIMTSLGPEASKVDPARLAHVREVLGSGDVAGRKDELLNELRYMMQNHALNVDNLTEDLATYEKEAKGISSGFINAPARGIVDAKYSALGAMAGSKEVGGKVYKFQTGGTGDPVKSDSTQTTSPSLLSMITEGISSYFSDDEAEEAAPKRLSTPKRVYNPEPEMTNLFKPGTEAHARREEEIRKAKLKKATLSPEEMEMVMSVSDPDGTEMGGGDAPTTGMRVTREPMPNQPNLADSIMAGLMAAETSSYPTSKQGLLDAFSAQSGTQNVLGSSAMGATQVIKDKFQGEGDVTTYDFMNRRLTEGVSGERPLLEQAESSFERYWAGGEIPAEDQKFIAEQLGGEFTIADIAALDHFAGRGTERQLSADMRDGKITAQEFLNYRPTSGNLTIGEYLKRFRKGMSQYGG